MGDKSRWVAGLELWWLRVELSGDYFIHYSYRSFRPNRDRATGHATGSHEGIDPCYHIGA